MTLLRDERLLEKETPTAPYEPLAPHYDAFVGAPRYGDWLAALLGLAAEHGVDGGRALDVGCGTGRSLEGLLHAGFEASGCDPSPAMLIQARERLGESVELGVSTLPEPLPAGPMLDLITAINDVLNYVEPSALESAFAVMAARLGPGGVLLFDANTPLTFTGFFSTAFCRDAGDRFFAWQPLEPEGRAYSADLTTFARDPADPARWQRSVSRHVQHHHPHADVRLALAAAGLDLLAVHGQRDDGGIDDHVDESAHSKRIYLARLP